MYISKTGNIKRATCNQNAIFAHKKPELQGKKSRFFNQNVKNIEKCDKITEKC